MLWSKEKFLASAGNQTSAVQPVAALTAANLVVITEKIVQGEKYIYIFFFK
jgi:hypothetical protein